MLPVILYSEDWDGPELSPTSFVWSSTNPGVAGVDSAGLITAHAPGTATIGASYGALSDSFTLSVRDWNIPEMLAQLDAIAFFGIDTTGTAPAREQRRYARAFLSSATREIWLELHVDVPPEANDERRLETTLSRELIAPGGSVTAENIQVLATLDSSELVIAHPLLTSPPPLQPGAYEVRIRRGSVVIQSSSFEVQ
jgi:hypothetical protein